MPNDTLMLSTRAAHEVGLAAWLGGSLFGNVALHRAVAGLDDPRERGKVTTGAWRVYDPINMAGLGVAAAGWWASRATETRPDKLTGTERTLSTVKDALMASAVVTGAITSVQGRRLSKQVPEGAVPVETGGTPAPEAPEKAAKTLRSVSVLGKVNVLAGLALVALNGVIAQLDHSRPPLRRGLLRRAS